METLLDLLLDFYGPTPYFLVFGILLACGLGLPVPEDVTLFAAGVLAYYGVCGLWQIVLISLFGVVIGDSFMFMLGAKYGRRLTRFRLFKNVLSEDRLDAVALKLKAAKGERLLFAARFMPGLRAPFFFTAGVLHVPYRKFLFYDGTAALLSVPAIIGAVYYFGDTLDRVVGVIKNIEHGIIFVIAAGLIFIGAKWCWKRGKRVA